ncbi:lactate utilization protein B/C [Nonlabens spongiae]|uniref:Lactate utilization protein B/C n=1 Tax=Nonlabens spongiae TaxID=331648 RepID=A0A1W6MK72_9FLAO|nr:LUD domain-containing protein [Nonlabens spongiae]ARN78014.1 lactate utilization protein B/C [Nonlabens spongiae]
MSLFKKLFNLSQKPEEKTQEKTPDERSKYMPEQPDLPVDERFIHHFTRLGGRFLYCLNQDEVDHNFKNIIKEHGWENSAAFCPDANLKERFDDLDLDISCNNLEADMLISRCEYIIADTGAILFSSNQVKQFKTFELPDTYVILASTSQIVESIGEGLRGIKIKNQRDIPTNITTLKHFKKNEHSDDKDLMTYGAAHKLVYLLLLEDL